MKSAVTSSTSGHLPAVSAHERRIAEALVPDFHRMAQGPVGVDRERATSAHAVVAAAREGEGFAGAARKEIEEGLEARGVETHLRRELPEDGAELPAQAQEPRGEEVGERAQRIAQLEHVREVAASLHREDEIVRRLLPPRLEEFRALQRVERAVDLEAREAPRGVVQLAALRESLRIEHAAPRFVAPPRDADANRALPRQALLLQRRRISCERTTSSRCRKRASSVVR